MTEALVATLIETLKTIIVDGVVAEARLLSGVKGDIKKLNNNLEATHALLEDAEEKQITDRGIKLWLDRLKEAAFDMEDALDEWRTRMLMQRQSDENASFLRRKVRKFLECFSFDHGIVRQHRMASNIKEINAKLDLIVKERDRYQLTVASSSNSQIKKQSRRRESTSLVDESRVVGRDGVKKEIISYLLCSGSSKEEETSSPVKTISIVGMGGSGKTTLAQVVYNDPHVKQHFPDRIWACVSEVFDEIQLAKAIIVGLEGLGKGGILQLQSVPLDALLQRICRSIQGKKFLLVLDDVWTEKERDFEELKLTFKNGVPGSMILVTTRNENVARVMESQHNVPLGLLSEELCWSILKKKALGGKTSCADLEQVGKRIAAKCNGLPLVAQTLGGLLQSKTDKRGWENVLNSEMWRLDIVQKDVFIPLLLSYYDLPPPIRRCFTFCAILPKDDIIYTCHLIAFWMAQGYLGSEDDDSSQLEMRGQEYCNILLARSLLQDFARDEDGFPYIKMHDLVHDFALFMCKDEFMVEEIYKGTNKDVKINHPEKTQHLNFMIEDGAYFPSTISSAEKLRSIICCGNDQVVYTRQAFRNLFMQTKRLRLLCLESLQFQDSTTIPEQVGKLLHLRYLEFSYSLELEELPRQICKLYNLQCLNLYLTGIEKLPEEMGNLINLRMLSTLRCPNLTCYPKSISNLTRLTQLIGAIVRTDCDHHQEFSLGDLADLKQLMFLAVKLVGESISADEARNVNLQNLEELQIHVDKDKEFMVEDDSIFEQLNMSWVPKRFFVDFDDYTCPKHERNFWSYL